MAWIAWTLCGVLLVVIIGLLLASREIEKDRNIQFSRAERLMMTSAQYRARVLKLEDMIKRAIGILDQDPDSLRLPD